MAACTQRLVGFALCSLGALEGELRAYPRVGDPARRLVQFPPPPDPRQNPYCPAGVLRSSDYSSLQPGSFVAFAGVYKSPAKADDAVAKIRASGIAGAPYVRFIGGHR